MNDVLLKTLFFLCLTDPVGNASKQDTGGVEVPLVGEEDEKKKQKRGLSSSSF
jgi:hypothetical protein